MRFETKLDLLDEVILVGLMGLKGVVKTIAFTFDRQEEMYEIEYVLNGDVKTIWRNPKEVNMA